jgi:hypothetical protein
MNLMPDKERHNTDRAEQLSLLSSQTLKALRSPFSRRLAAPTTQSSQAEGIRNAHPSNGDATQLRLPGL